MSIDRRSLLLLTSLLAACAGGPRRADPALGRDGALLATVALDERGANAAMVARWAVIAGSGRGDEALALFAVDRLDALVAEGVADAAATETLARLARAPLSDEASRRVALARARLARLSGDDAGALALEREAGCALPWRAGQSVGRLPRLDLTRSPDQATVEGALTPARVRGCRVVALTSDGRPAALPLVLDLSIERAGAVELVVGADAPYQVHVDGAPGPAPDGHAPPRRVRRYRFVLPPGRHRVTVTGAAIYGRLEAELAVRAPGLGLRAASGTPAVARGAVRVVEVPPVTCQARRPRLEALFLEAAGAVRDGDGARARLAVARLLEASPRLGVGLALAARVAAGDGTVPTRLARDRARRLYERALEADPAMSRVRYEAGRLALARDRAREAIELADGAPDRRELWAALLRSEVLRARGRDPEVRRALAAVPAAQAQACALVEARASDDRLRHLPTQLEPARRLSRCRLGSTALGDALRLRGELDEAIAEYRRVVADDPMAEAARVALGETLLQRGRAAESAQVFAELVAIAPRAATFRLHLVDALQAADRPADAQRALDAGLALDPENAELAAASRSLGRGTDPAADVDVDRIDGRGVIADFEHAGRRYDGPAVFVLDRSVSRVYATGGQRTITHNIIKVLAKDGIDRWGEWHLPQGAEVLTLCAWKPGGARLEPEEVPEKESISIPGLAVGDYVEVEYLERAAPPGAFPGGFLAERFYFASLDAPLDRSEYTLVTPPDMPVEIDARGAPPAVEESVRKEGRAEVKVRRFVARKVEQRFAEPGAAPMAEFMPSVRASARVSRAAWRAYLTDLGWAARRRDPALDELAARLTAGDKNDRQRLLHLDAWVRKNVRHGGGLDDAATAILARREGNRATLLAALAEAAGLPARILLGRSARSARIEGELEGFDQALVEAGGIVVDPRYRHGQPGELPAALRGELALVLEPGVAEPVRLPEATTDARQMKVTIALRADGGGKVRVEERLRGWPALEWRESLERLPVDRVRPQFEQRTLGYFFPGAALEDLTWEAADRDDQPFVVRYSMDAPSIARRHGDALVLPAPFAAQLLRRYATGHARSTPVYVDEVSPTDLDLTVELPAGARVEVGPALHRDEKVGRFEQRTWLEGGALHMRSRFFLPTQRVAVDAWPAFLAWVAAVDRAEAAVAQITVAATGPAGSR
jgi:tetratricopeptide (TPR) repeat protein